MVNHNAIHFPCLQYQAGTGAHALGVKAGEAEPEARFDRIVCDVPCSSDAAIRKIPQKWATWSLKDGASLHQIQLGILERGLELLKPGGLLTYSTCSLNPIENEAVVAAAIKNKASAGVKVTILDSREKLGSFRTREGLSSWLVCDDFDKITRKREAKAERKDTLGFDDCFKVLDSYEDVPKDRRTLIKETFFPPPAEELKEMGIQKCLRVFPHDQNTSGFFIVLL